jgi:hypothetical protein
MYRKYGVDVTKTVLTVTIYSSFDFLKFFKTKVVIAESSPLAASMVAEDYPGALATGEFHCGLLAALQREMSAGVPYSLRSRESAAARARALRFVCRRSRYASVSTTSDAANCG